MSAASTKIAPVNFPTGEPATPAAPTRFGASRLTLGVVALLWVATRGLMLVIWQFEQSVSGDVGYYWVRIANYSQVGLTNTLIEYPTPVVGILSLPYLLGGGTRGGYYVAFIALMMLLDAILTWLLWLRGGHRGARGVLFWIAFVFLIGPLCYLRFDMIPAVLAGSALVLLSRRPGVAGALIGLGAAIKLWPALLLPALLGKRDGRVRAIGSFVAAGFGLALISLIVGGWQRLISPLTWQADRGLQVEAVWATPIMIARALDPAAHTISMSKYQAYEIFGPGVGAMQTVSNVATVVGVAAIAALAVRVLWRKESSLTTAALLMVSIVAIMIITNKTLSPQYVLWLGGPLAVLLLGRRVDEDRPEWMRRAVLRLAMLTLAVAGLTHLVYPITYGAVVFGTPGPQLTIAMIVLAARNVALLIIAVWAIALTWMSAGHDERSVYER